MIRDLEIENFRRFERLELHDLGRVNLIVGANNAIMPPEPPPPPPPREPAPPPPPAPDASTAPVIKIWPPETR